jgi:hypothetical protein
MAVTHYAWIILVKVASCRTMARLINATNVVIVLAQSVADVGDRGRIGDVASINLSRVRVSLAQMVKLGFVFGTSGSREALTRKM